MIDIPQGLSVVLILGITMGVAWVMAPYIAGVFKRKPSRLDRILDPIERGIYRATGVDQAHEMGWKEYFLAGLLVNLAQMVIAFFILTFATGAASYYAFKIYRKKQGVNLNLLYTQIPVE